MRSQTVQLKLFGGFQALLEQDVCVEVPLQRARLLLAYVALNPSGRARREELIALLWSARGETQARQSLRQTIAVIRRAFSGKGVDLLKADSESVSIDLSAINSDVAAFNHFARKAGAQDLEAAATLYAGDFLAGVQIPDQCAEEWIATQRASLQSSLLRCLSALLAAYRRLDRHNDIERIATRILALDPYDEDAHRALIGVHLFRGQRITAFRQLQRCRDSLRELSLTPGPETEALVRSFAPRPRSLTARPVANARAEQSRSRGEGQDPVAERTRQGPGGKAGISVIVAPFDALGDLGRAELLAYGLIQDIVIDLSRFTSLSVVPPGPVASLNQRPIDPLAIGSKLGVQYVLTGSVEAHDGRVRVACTLLDAKDAHVVWGDRYDRRLCDFIDIRDELARRIAAAASSSADAAEFERAKLADTRELGPWQLRALAQRKFHAFTPHQNAEARSLFGRALELDPAFVRARVGLGWTHFEDFCFVWTKEPQASLLQSHELVSQSLLGDPRLFSARCLLSYIYFFRHQFDEAVEECKLARADNANDPEIILHEGHLLACTGQPVAGMDRVEEAIALDPTHPNWFHYIHAVTAFEAERFDTSLSAVNRYIQLQAGPFVGLKGSALRIRAAANAMSDRMDAARRDARDFLAMNPDFQVSAYVRRMNRQDPKSLDRMTVALREAGLPA
jgi:DNA-binding SARP family transcriptional activator/TolB-like protein